MLTRILLAAALTVAVETPVVAVAYRREWLKMALTCALATTCTNLLMNASLPWLQMFVSYWTLLVAWECAAMVVEATVYAIVSERHNISHAFVASGLANAASFVVALLVF